MSKTTKYWKGLEELNNGSEFARSKENEFQEHIPVEDFLGSESLDATSTSRRDFLKFLGFSVTAASLAACETPVNKAIPYVVKPEEITPGVANWYASTYFDGTDYCSVLVKTREGRPIKIEGNELSPITKGGVNARVHASVLSLYDSGRITGPYAAKVPASWQQVDADIKKKLEAISAKGGNIRVLSSTIISPSTKQVIADFIAKYPTAKHITYDAVSYSAIIKANWNSFDKGIIPSYNFDKANVIVSIGADFLANWISPIEFSKQYVKNRKVSKEKKSMSKHYQFEANLSLTGSNADKRIPVKPSEYGAIAVSLYNAVAKLTSGTPAASSSTPYDAVIEAAAKKLVENKGKSLVVCGSNDTATQIVINSINSLLGSYGNTIDTENPSNLKQGDDEKFTGLVKEMNEGKVDALFTYNVNPVYTAPGALDFAGAYQKVGLKVSFADRIDETAEWADYVCPDHHYLESWNDANPKGVHYSLGQPTISPLFVQPKYEGTRCAQESLLNWAGNDSDYYNYMKKYWSSHVFPMQGKYMTFSEFWNNALHNGVVEVGVGEADKNMMAIADSTGVPMMLKKEKAKPEKKKEKKEEVNESENTMSVAEAAVSIEKSAKGGTWELVVYEKTGIGNGNQANNPWLQEFPDPVSKVTWDNYITMNPADMQGKYERNERYDQINMKFDLANVTVGNNTVELPVFPQPGQAKGTIGIALGYGRTKAGKCGDNVGKNAFQFVQLVNGTMQYFTDAEVSEKTGTQYQLACTQTHHTMMGRKIVNETDLHTYNNYPKEHWNETEMIHTTKGEVVPTKANLWADYETPGQHWGLSIDLNSCIGCGACIVSCNAENNITVVGKEEVRKSREMHWIRIDRYYTSDMTKAVAEKEHEGAIDMYLEMEKPNSENPRVVFQPIMCQHCNHAPCETVCPVLATTHSSDGLNQMTYNRCVGTRYCANNCPFKVRRFNWFEYDTNSRFANVNPSQDDLGRMVLNPDVVVRSRGVMEKCSMCIQRIQEGKLTAKKEMRKIVDGEIQTACSKSCPTNAIIFGDLNDENSEIAKWAADERAYHVLEEIGVQPSVSYLTKVRNLDADEIAMNDMGEGKKEKKEEHDDD